MKISAVSDDYIINYLREDPTDAEVRTMIAPMKTAALEYLAAHTGLDQSGLDQYEDLTFAYLMLIEDLYDNRSTTVSSSTRNKTLDTILSLHSLHNIG
ncbi:MAG: phage gp6-like head-tail connector protein [Ruminococcus sp.]|nr:phage gp6-like head-tail connector protein [Ruminococcus sp.]